MPYIGSLRNEPCTASPNQAAYGATVTITADDIHGKVFSGWTVESGGVTLADSSAKTTAFTMGAKAVEIRANYIWFAVPLAELIAAVFWGGDDGALYKTAQVN